MRPEAHLFVSAALSSVFYLLTGSVEGAVAVFVGGFFIDLDHFLDFWIYKRRITYTSEFFSHYSLKMGKMYVLLHSVELLWLLCFAQVVTGSTALLGFCVGMTVHLVMDMLGNGKNPMMYFMSYRIMNGFRIELLRWKKKW